MTGATKAAPQELTAVEYARPAGMSLCFDARIPDGEGPFSAAILVHGGGWVRGDRRVEVAPLFQPLSDAKIAWFPISYRLAASPLPALRCRWPRKKRRVTCGSSSGGMPTPPSATSSRTAPLPRRAVGDVDEARLPNAVTRRPVMRSQRDDPE